MQHRLDSHNTNTTHSPSLGNLQCQKNSTGAGKEASIPFSRSLRLHCLCSSRNPFLSLYSARVGARLSFFDTWHTWHTWQAASSISSFPLRRYRDNCEWARYSTTSTYPFTPPF